MTMPAIEPKPPEKPTLDTSSTVPPGGTVIPAPPPAPEWKAGPEAKEWARGKTGPEILAMGEKMAETLAKFNQTSVIAQPPQQYQAPPPPSQRWDADIPEDEYLTGKQFRAYAQRYAQEAANAPNPQAARAMELNASNAVAIASVKYAKDFAKYGPEIHATIAKLPIEARTLDNLDTVVRMVRSDHVDELAAERAQELAQQIAPTLRSQGGGFGTQATVDKSNTLESDKLPADYKERLAKAGVSLETVREFCASNEMPVDQWFKLFDKTLITETR